MKLEEAIKSGRRFRQVDSLTDEWWICDHKQGSMIIREVAPWIRLPPTLDNLFTSEWEIDKSEPVRLQPVEEKKEVKRVVYASQSAEWRKKQEMDQIFDELGE